MRQDVGADCEDETSAKKSFAPSVTRLRPDLDCRKFYALGTYGTL